MKRFIAVLLLLVLVLSVSGCASKTYEVEAMSGIRDFFHPTFEELVERNIIVGKAKSSTPILTITEDEHRPYEAYTLSEIEVEEVIVGDLKKGDTIYVNEFGDGEVFICYKTEKFGGNINEGDYLILILNRNPYELEYLVQGKKTYREKDYTYIIKSAGGLKKISNCYSTPACQGRIWLTEDKQIDPERNQALLEWTGLRIEVIRKGETYEEFVSRIKDTFKNLSNTE